MALDLIARQITPTSVYGCQYNYNAVAACVEGVGADDYPSCYNYVTDQNCCSTWLSWEYSYLDCLQTAYQNCYDFQGYASEISDLLPCYTNHPLTAPASTHVQVTTTGSVPSLVLQAISTAGPTTRPPHDPLPSYSGTGGLLSGYCNTADFALLDGPTAYWAPVIGCVNDKSDCCPYATAPSTTTGPTATTVTVVSTVTVNSGPSGLATQPAANGIYPVALNPNQATLARCPDDYVVIGSACCPSGYSLWNAALGGQVPCYSSLKATTSPPPVPVTSLLQTTSSHAIASTFQKPTSAIVNIVYAIQYAVQPSSPGGLSTGAKAGIGAGAGIIALGLIGLASFCFWRYRKNRKSQTAFTGQAPPPVAQTAPVYPPPQGQPPQGQYGYGQAPPLGGQAPPAYLPPPGQYGYGQPQPEIQPQPGVPVGSYYGAKGIEPQVSQVPTQSPVSYPPPTASPPPTDGYSYQGHQSGYFPQGQPSNYAPSSAASELPVQHAYAYPSQPPSSASSPPREVQATPARRPVGSPPQGQPAPIQELGAHQQYAESPGAEMSGSPRPGEMA